jgi:VWFA-related protein
MQYKQAISVAAATAVLLVTGWLLAADRASAPDTTNGANGQIKIPARSSAPLFKGKQGKQKTEIHYDPSTGTVTLKFLVQDPNGYFIPNIRRDNFVVYENGVRQQNVSVDVEHAAVSLGFLGEFGGRIQSLNRDLGQEVSRAGQHLVDEVGRGDKVAIWTYNDKVEKLSDFSSDPQDLNIIFIRLGTPELSEANLYDAVINTLGQMKPLNGRKAILLVSSGIDTFSKNSLQDATRAAEDSGTPIYVLSLVPTLRQMAEGGAHTGAIAKIDWEGAENGMQQIAVASGGRLYSPENTVDLTPVYDDMMENLKVRYVITYKPSDSQDQNAPRTVRVELVDPRTGGPLQIVDSNGKVIRASVILQDSYVPKNSLNERAKNSQ